MASNLPGQKELRAIFDYMPEGGVLIWKHRKDKSSQWNGRYAGKAAGSVSHGYRQTKVNGKKRLVHRIVWVMAYGQIPDSMIIDHIDGDGLNNRLDNLRVVTNAQNQLNRKADVGRKFKGVYQTKRGYKAEITHQGNRIYLGVFKSDLEAAKAYDKKAKELHGRHAKLNFHKEEIAA